MAFNTTTKRSWDQQAFLASLRISSVVFLLRLCVIELNINPRFRACPPPRHQGWFRPNGSRLPMQLSTGVTSLLSCLSPYCFNGFGSQEHSLFSCMFPSAPVAVQFADHPIDSLVWGIICILTVVVKDYKGLVIQVRAFAR